MSVKARNFTAGMINRCHPLSEICYDVTPAGLAVQCPGLPHLPLLARPVSAVPFPLPHHPADIFIQFYIRIDMRSRCCWRHFSFAVLWHEGVQKYILSGHGSHFYAIKHSERLEGGFGCPKLSCQQHHEPQTSSGTVSLILNCLTTTCSNNRDQSHPQAPPPQYGG